MAAYSGVVKFIYETNKGALVEETKDGDASPTGHKVLNADFSAKVRDNTIDYSYDAMSADNDGRDVTIV